MTSQNDPLNAIGKEIDGRYLVERFVAEGGFSYVYRALHKIWNQPVAIKFLKAMPHATPAQREVLLAGFRQEGAILREMSSRTASILQAHDVGEWICEDGQWRSFLVLEWLDGESLEEVLQRDAASGTAAWSLAECMQLLDPAAQALAGVHQRDVAHRDLKPANLFVMGEARSGKAFVKVLDFGIAKVVQGTQSLNETATGATGSSFTPCYGAPEQFSRARFGATGPWTDVYALALVLVEMLTLRAPLDGDDIAQLGFATSDLSVRPTPRARGARVNDTVELVFRKALAVQPRDRFASIGEFWAALREASGTAELADSSGVVAPKSSVTSSAGRFTPQALAATIPAVDTEPQGAPNSAKSSPSRVQLIGLAAGGLLALSGLGFALGRSGGGPPMPPSASTVPTATASSTATGKAVAPAVAKTACPERMLPIPAGNMQMGYDGKGALDSERPVHPVAISAFCVDRTEVTVDMYKNCSNSGKCVRAATAVEFPAMTADDEQTFSALCNENLPDNGQHPINCVTWEMARTYCATISARLPTSAEWEYAARGSDGRVYPWGDQLPDHTHLNGCGAECKAWGANLKVKRNYALMYDGDDGFANTAPVGSFPAGRSKYGVEDVIGNVMEWVVDWDGKYAKSEDAQRDPSGPAAGTERVIRGGAWTAENKIWTRPSFRFQFPPNTRSHAVGFRCAKAQEAKLD